MRQYQDLFFELITMTFNSHEEYLAGIERANHLVDANDNPWGVPEFTELTDAIEIYETANPQLFPNLKSNAS
jgi:hypothetical protein